MTSLPVYHFPETDITFNDVRGQLLFFSKIFFLAPVENEDTEPNALCQAYTPVPLGDDLQRFQHLLAELKGNETAFYQGQLSNMALEYMENRNPESVRDIINNLHDPQNPQVSTPKISKNQENLWQARLFLKLAEILRQEEKVLTEGLASMDERQDELFQALKGDDLDDLMQSLADTARPQFPIRVESLIKAWGRLMLAGDHQPWFLNCSSQEAAEPFFEANENISGKRPVRLLRLPLPDCDQDPENYLEKRQIWQDQLTDSRQKSADILLDIASHGLGPSSLADLAQIAAHWTKLYGQNMWPEPTVTGSPQKCCVTPHLEIYLLNHSIVQLLAKLCGQKHVPENAEHVKYGLIAVLSSRSSTCKG